MVLYDATKRDPHPYHDIEETLAFCEQASRGLTLIEKQFKKDRDEIFKYWNIKD